MCVCLRVSVYVNVSLSVTLSVFMFVLKSSPQILNLTHSLFCFTLSTCQMPKNQKQNSAHTVPLSKTSHDC